MQCDPETASAPPLANPSSLRCATCCRRCKPPQCAGKVLPERVPADGLLILRDGEPGEPEMTLSPLRYHYQHRAEIEAVVQGADRDAAFDALNGLLRLIARSIIGDKTGTPSSACTRLTSSARQFVPGRFSGETGLPHPNASKSEGRGYLLCQCHVVWVKYLINVRVRAGEAN